MPVGGSSCVQAWILISLAWFGVGGVPTDEAESWLDQEVCNVVNPVSLRSQLQGRLL